MGISMQDKTALHRFARIMGGKVYGPYLYSRADRQSPPIYEYKWNARGAEDVRRIFDILKGRLTKVKQEQGRQAIIEWDCR